MTARPASAADVDRVAQLHAARINEGFLTSLGVPFLHRLYRRVLRAPDAFIIVEEGEHEIVGFVAGVADLGALYRRFMIRDGALGALRAAPRLVRAIPRVLETMRYPTTTADLPDAEILAVAVAGDHEGRGIGRQLVDAATTSFRNRGIDTAKVVTTADNPAALAMYRACGFVSKAEVEVHAGRESEVLVWTAS